jgi:hypothetical protein
VFTEKLHSGTRFNTHHNLAPRGNMSSQKQSRSTSTPVVVTRSQTARGTTWSTKMLSRASGMVWDQQQRHPQIAPQTFRHNPMAQSRPNLPSLNASPWNPLSKIVSYKNCGACLDMEETREHLLSFPSRGVLSLENFHSWCGCSLFSNCKIGTSAT